jgi:deoxyhypusine synthase
MPRKRLPHLGTQTPWLGKSDAKKKRALLSGPRILPKALTGRESLTTVVESALLAYNGRKLKEACRLFADRMLKKNVTVALSLTGALTPAGLGASCVVPLIRAGFVDWIVSTGANLYHDLHFAFDLPLHTGSHETDDTALRDNDIVRIYDIFLGYTDCLLKTDKLFQEIVDREEFEKEMGTAEFHYLLGRFAAGLERKAGLKNVSVLAAAYRAGVPVFSSSPGDSTMGMNIAMLELAGHKLRINPSIDVNESTAIVLDAKRKGKTGVIILGGGSPKNFVLQTEPHIQEILGLEDMGHDYFVQVTDSRPDTGGLSGATPSEAVSWGKVNPGELPNAVVAYLDSTVALPIMTHYALANAKKRPQRRLYNRREAMLDYLAKEFRRVNLDG